jgi:DNA-binding NtrC family response regulator
VTDADTPELDSVEPLSFIRGRRAGQPVVVIYNEVKDETTVIAPESRGYDSAIAAISLLELLATPDPKLKSRAVRVPKRRLIMPGNDVSH